MNKRIWLLIMAFVLALALVACGGGGETAEPTEAPAPTEEEAAPTEEAATEGPCAGDIKKAQDTFTVDHL